MSRTRFPRSHARSSSVVSPLAVPRALLRRDLWAFIFVTGLYDDPSDIPPTFLYGIEAPGRAWSVESFVNRD